MENKVKEIVAEQLGFKVEEVTLEAHLENDLEADSLDKVELVMVLEEELDIEIPDPDAEKFETVKDVVEYCEKQKNKPAHAR